MAAKINLITMQFFFSGRQKWFARAMSMLKTRQEDLPIFSRLILGKVAV